MFERMFMPLDRQLDDGLFVAGESFKRAADRLAEHPDSGIAALHSHLPVNFLYRHSIELLLKSMIVTIHRALLLPTGDDVHSPDPKVQHGSKWKPLKTIHSVKMLLDEVNRLVRVNDAAIKSRTRGDWTAPPMLEEWIAVIEAIDAGSTFSRYPRTDSSADAKKSGFVPINLPELAEELQREGEFGKMVMLFTDDNDVVVDSYASQTNPLPEFREALVKASDMLIGACIGIYAELVTGRGGHQ